MERLCEKCGSLVSGDVSFCPACGQPLQSAVNLDKPAQPMQPMQQAQPMQPGYMNQPNYMNPPNYVNQPNYGYGAPQYGQSNMQNNMQSNARYEPMTVGQWVGTFILCSWFGIISIILNIVWGFGADTPEPKRSFCKAMLVMNIIGIALGIFVTFIMIVGGIGIAGLTGDWYYDF